MVWTKGVEGWVYFKCDEYITIEHIVRPKDEVNLECCPIHRNEQLLVLCYASTLPDYHQERLTNRLSLNK